jgi:DNA-binding response OmpR family regulator
MTHRLGTPQHHTVLVVDDEPDICAVVRDALEGESYRVTCHTSGDAGLQTAQAQPPDLVILDWRLAGVVTGAEVLEQLRSDGRTNGSSVLLLTAAPDLVEGEAVLEVGQVELLGKPFELEELFDAVARLTQRSTGELSP